MEIEITYEVDDGYVGGSKPQRLTIETDDFEGMTAEEIKKHLYGLIWEDMLEVVNPTYEEGEILDQINGGLEELRKENEEEMDEFDEEDEDEE